MAESAFSASASGSLFDRPLQPSPRCSKQRRGGSRKRESGAAARCPGEFCNPRNAPEPLRPSKSRASVSKPGPNSVVPCNSAHTSSMTQSAGIASQAGGPASARGRRRRLKRRGADRLEAYPTAAKNNAGNPARGCRRRRNLVPSPPNRQAKGEVAGNECFCCNSISGPRPLNWIRSCSSLFSLAHLQQPAQFVCAVRRRGYFSTTSRFGSAGLDRVIRSGKVSRSATCFGG